jgi:hypothetical protein
MEVAMKIADTRPVVDAFTLDVMLYNDDHSIKLGRPTMTLGFDPASREIKWFKVTLGRNLKHPVGARTLPGHRVPATIERAMNWIAKRLHSWILSRSNKSDSFSDGLTLAKLEQWLSSEIKKYPK